MTDEADVSQREIHPLTPVRIERTTYSLGKRKAATLQSETQSWEGLKRTASPTTSPQQNHAGVEAEKRNSLSAAGQEKRPPHPTPASAEGAAT
jgi:hypothetical protein